MESAINIDPQQIQGFLDRIRDKVTEKDFQFAQQWGELFAQLHTQLGQKRTSIQRLQKLLFGTKTEKTATLCPQPRPKPPTRKPARGHGRNGAEAYPGAEKIPIAAPWKPGEVCPDCQEGRLYDQKSGNLLHIQGQPLFKATLYQPERLRCHCCGKCYQAPLPAEATGPKYDASVGPLLGLTRYGMGVPLYRIQKLQQSFGVPMPASTQYELIRDCASHLLPVFECLQSQAAQGEIFYNDDTNMKIRALPAPESDQKERTGIFTTCIVSQCEKRKIALYFTGRKHAGENLAELLGKRAAHESLPIQMCDGLSRNWPKNHDTERGQCLVHGRRNFVEILATFPEQCRRVIRELEKIYRLESRTRRQNLDASQRLAYHQRYSLKVLGKLKSWMQAQLDTKQCEPNSALGQAYNYMLKRWKEMTLFLREPGAPLDNNLCERMLKPVILHRKNSLFFRTQNGARVGDLFMSLIHTCTLNKVDPLDYLTFLNRQADKLSVSPQNWLPWNYRQNLAQSDTS
jgi:transposase